MAAVNNACLRLVKPIQLMLVKIYDKNMQDNNHIINYLFVCDNIAIGSSSQNFVTLGINSVTLEAIHIMVICKMHHSVISTGCS